MSIAVRRTLGTDVGKYDCKWVCCRTRKYAILNTDPLQMIY
jgi:hypothetical protein